jgi:hypothetical protein
VRGIAGVAHGLGHLFLRGEEQHTSCVRSGAIGSCGLAHGGEDVDQAARVGGAVAGRDDVGGLGGVEHVL